MKVKASLNNIRIAPRKTRLVANFIKGMDVLEALNQLDVRVKRTNPYMKKLLLSAIANSENNYGLDRNNLYVFDARIEAGPTLKRWMPKAFGRAGQILKRTSKINIILEERVEGKGRKSKEEMEKEKQKRLEEKKRQEKEMAESQDEKSKKVEKTEEVKKEEDYAKKDGAKKGWARKIFQRKSM